MSITGKICRLLGVTLIILISGLHPLWCQAGKDDALSLDECIEMAKINNKEIQAARSQKSYSEYSLRSVKANYFPSVSLYSRGFYTTIGDTYSLKDIDMGAIAAKYPDLQPYIAEISQMPVFGSLAELIRFEYALDWTFMGGISLQQPVYMGGKVRTGYRMAKLGVELAAQNVRLTESQVIVETSKAYADVVKAEELYEVAQKYNALLEKLMHDVESALRNGVKQKNDLLKVQVKLNESLLNVTKARNGLKLATMNLCHMIGKPLMSDIEVNGVLPEYSAGIKGEPVITNRPEYMMYDSKEELAREQVNMERSDKLPQLAVLAQYGYTSALKLYGKQFINDDSFMAGVSLSIPIFHFGEKNNKMKAVKAQYEQTRLERQNINDLILLEATRAANNYEESLLELEIATSSLSAADENLRMSDRQYAAGVESLSDLLEAQLLWQQAYQAQIEARISTFVSWLEYRKAIGELN